MNNPVYNLREAAKRKRDAATLAALHAKIDSLEREVDKRQAQAIHYINQINTLHVTAASKAGVYDAYMKPKKDPSDA